MAVVGGLRDRFIRDSLYTQMNEALTGLGWFDPARKHLPIRFSAEPLENEESILLNTLTMSDEDKSGEYIELGTGLTEHRWTMYFDFYAESRTMGLHVTGDIKDLLEGRMPSRGFRNGRFPVYDYSLAVPAHIFTVSIEDVVRDRAHDFPKPFQKNWYTVRFDIMDEYDTEEQDDIGGGMDVYGGY